MLRVEQIIGLGPQSVPLLVEDFRSGPRHWFWALRAILGEDVAEAATTLPEAASLWISRVEDAA